MQYGRRNNRAQAQSTNRQNVPNTTSRPSRSDPYRATSGATSQNARPTRQAHGTRTNVPPNQNTPRRQNGAASQYGYAGRQDHAGRQGYAGTQGYRDPQRDRSYASSGSRAQRPQYRDPRAEAYIRQRREAELREMSRRRAEYERRRAVAREARRRLEEQIKKERKMKRKKQRKIFFGRALVCLIVFAMLSVVTGIFFALHFGFSPDSPPSKIKYVFGGAVTRVADADSAYRNGKAYICFNDVAAYLGLSVTGDTESMSFIFTDADTDDFGSAGSGSEDIVKFMMDSRTVYINSQRMTLPAESFLYGESVWVSVRFIEEFVEGLTVTQKDDTLTVSRVEDPELSSDDETVYAKVSLKLKSADPIPSQDGGENKDEISVPNVTFTTDLSSYEEYMNPEKPEEYLILVNEWNTLDVTHVPSDLVEVANTRADGREAQQLRESAAKALEALFIEMKAAGHTDVSVTSAYRSYESQEFLHNSYIEGEMAADPTLTREAAEAKVLTYSAVAGTSEHQTGLCVDMHNLDSANAQFAETDAYRWLYDNAWKFGYVLRFPESKTDVTGISFEPWHWRFVGRDAAYEIHTGGMCLEEYAAKY